MRDGQPARETGFSELHLFDGPRLQIGEVHGRQKLLLRGRTGNSAFAEAVRSHTGLSLPSEPNRSTGDDPACLWLSPTGWLITGTVFRAESLGSALRSALEDVHGDAIDVTDEYRQFAIGGPCASDLLATCCAVDFSPTPFGPRRVAKTLIAGITGIVHRAAEEEVIDLYVDRSYRHYLADALISQAREFA